MEEHVDCPYCDNDCTGSAEYVHNGVGYQQVSPYHCHHCGATEIGPHDNYKQDLSDYEIMHGWYEPTLKQGTDTMNYSTAIFLANDAVRAVNVSYDLDPITGKGNRPFYTFKTFDQSIEVGDFVLVPTNTRHKMTAVRVEEINVEVEPTSTIELKWVIQKLDTTLYEDTLKKEESMIATIKSAKRRREREKLQEELIADNPELANFAQLAPPIEGAVNPQAFNYTPEVPPAPEDYLTPPSVDDKPFI